MNRLWPMLVVAVALIAMIANGGAQMDLDEPAIDIRGELEQIRARQGQSINAIRQSFYLGNLAISSKRYEAARLVYKQVVDIANSVPAGQRPLADPFRRRALMGTAILDMELYLDQPIRLKSYSSDSLARWELLRDVRDQFALLTQEQFAPVVAEAAVQRAYMFEMWDTGSLDSAALEVGDLRSLTTALSDLNVAVNLTAQADSEYAAVVVLKDREGLGEAPDLDVSRWVSVAQDRQHEVSLKQDTLHARAEAIQAMIIEQRFDAWYPDLKRTMETKIAELRTRGSGATDPFGDALLPKSFFDRAVAPRMFEGPLSVFDSHDSAASTAAMVMPHDWVALRREWESDVAWERRRVEANLMSAAIDDARRAPDTLQAHLQTWSHLGQSLPNGLETLFEPLPTEDDMGYLAGLAQQEGQAMWGDPSQTLAFEYVTERRQYETEMAQVQSEMASFRRVLEAFTPQRDGGGGDSLVKRYLATRDETLRLIWLNSDTLLTAIADGSVWWFHRR